MERSCGILLPVFSLPSPYGIGTLGLEARRFVDFLAEAGQSWWQVLPLGPTGFGDSPYQSFSSFAGNPYLIDPEELREEGLLSSGEIHGLCWGDDPSRVNYGLLYQNRATLLKSAAERGLRRYSREIDAFRQANRDWLEDYSLFMAIKDKYGGRPWQQWPEPLRRHDAGALSEISSALTGEISFHVFCQYKFFQQYHNLREYAGK